MVFCVVVCYVARVLCDRLFIQFGGALPSVIVSVLELSIPTNSLLSHDLC